MTNQANEGCSLSDRREGPPPPRVEADRLTLYTIGHSNRTARELVDILLAWSVARVVDVRRVPRSRSNPQFNLDVLPGTLADAGLAYTHLAALGGLRARIKSIDQEINAGWTRRPFHNYADYALTPPFREGLRDLLEIASRQTCAIMCAEAVWWRCHRRIIADHLLVHGVPVVHLFTATEQAPASLTPFALVGANLDISYPAPKGQPGSSEMLLPLAGLTTPRDGG
jgi:hypothetical protein